MGDGLPFKAELELAEKQIGDESGDDKGYYPVEEVKILEHYEVAQGPDGAKTASLGQPADQKPRGKRQSNGRCHGAGTFFGEKYSRRALGTEAWTQEDKGNERYRRKGHDITQGFFRGIIPAQAKTSPQKGDPYGHSNCQSKDAGDGV